MKCDECEKHEVYRFNLCEECYSSMFYGKSETHKISIIRKEDAASEPYFILEYVLAEGTRATQGDQLISSQEKYQLIEEFQRTGKINVRKHQLYSFREEIEEVEPTLIRFLPVEGAYIKTTAFIMLPATFKPKLVWTRSDWERWQRESDKILSDFFLPMREQHKRQEKLCEEFGMKRK